jgi:methyltransferase family protein
MVIQRLKDSFLSSIKKGLLKGGYTVLRGDIRKSIRENGNNAVPPQRLLKNARIFADRYAVLQELPRGGTVVEVGVAYGDFTRPLLAILQPDTFIAIDNFSISPEDEPWGRQLLKDNRCNHYDYYCSQFRERIADGSMVVRKGLSWEMIATLPDNSVDYMYVDADHSYQSVFKEIKALKTKMKPGGLVQFNDYTFFNSNTMEAYGVPAAVHEFMVEENYEMLYLCLHPDGFYDVVIRKADISMEDAGLGK